MRSKEGRRPGREGCVMKIKGITQEVTTCDACGRVNLKKTIVFEDSQGCLHYYGSECAKIIEAYANMPARDIVKKASSIQKQNIELAKQEFNNNPIVKEYRRKFDEYLQAHEGNPLSERLAFLGNLKRQYMDEADRIKEELKKKYHIKELHVYL